MKRPATLVLAALCAIALHAAVAVAAPAAATPAPAPAPDLFASVTVVANFLLAHWQDLGTLLATLVAMYAAFRQHQWDKLVQLAGGIAFNVATLTNLDNAAKRKEVEDRLYTATPVWMHLLFGQAQFEMACEAGWQLIAKPKTAA
jgi:hypothetical protein